MSRVGELRIKGGGPMTGSAGRGGVEGAETQGLFVPQFALDSFYLFILYSVWLWESTD